VYKAYNYNYKALFHFISFHLFESDTRSIGTYTKTQKKMFRHISSDCSGDLLMRK